MEKKNKKINRTVNISYCNKFLEISQSKKTYCLINKYDFKYLGAERTIRYSQETLIYQFANELHIEYELLDTEIANLVFHIVLLSANKLKCINDRVFESLYNVFKPSSDKQWSEMIKLMDHEGNIRNTINKSLDSEITELENVETHIKQQVRNLRILENKQLQGLCEKLFESKDRKAQDICSVIIDTFVLSFEEQNLITTEFNRKMKIDGEFISLAETQCSEYQIKTEKMQKNVQLFIDCKNIADPNSNNQFLIFRNRFFSIHFPDFKSIAHEIMYKGLKK